MHAQAEQLSLFAAERWPRKPYCTDELGSVQIRPLATAQRRRYIQPNAPSIKFRLVYDVDRPGAAMAWDDAGVATANWSAANPENAHAHLGYEIAVPVILSEAARMAPVRLAAAIERAYTEALGADLGYAGLLCKNPLHPDWKTAIWRAEPYELAELADYVDLDRFRDRRRRPRSTGIGRNVELFDRLRRWAYSNVRHYWRPGGFDAWAAEILERAEAFNDFPDPLPWSEIKATARSVSKWVWQHLTPSTFASYVENTHASEVQAKRGRKSGQVRAEAAAGKADQARELRAAGMSQRAIARELGVSVGAVNRYLRG